MATITMPTGKLRSVTVSRSKAVAVSQNTFTGAQKVYQYPASVITLEFQVTLLGEDDAATWTNFLDDLEGGANTFQFDVSSVAPGTNFAAMTTTSFRLADSTVTWTKGVHGHYEMSFSAVEAIST